MRLLVDTSAYSAFLRGHDTVVEEMARGTRLVVTPIVLGELLAGFRKGTRFARNVESLRDFLTSPRAQLIGLDDETADRYSVLHHHLRLSGDSVPTNDLWIAASALQHGLRLITTDSHFQRISQIVVSFHETSP